MAKRDVFRQLRRRTISFARSGRAWQKPRPGCSGDRFSAAQGFEFERTNQARLHGEDDVPAAGGLQRLLRVVLPPPPIEASSGGLHRGTRSRPSAGTGPRGAELPDRGPRPALGGGHHLHSDLVELPVPGRRPQRLEPSHRGLVLSTSCPVPPASTKGRPRDSPAPVCSTSLIARCVNRCDSLYTGGLLWARSLSIADTSKR